MVLNQVDLQVDLHEQHQPAGKCHINELGGQNDIRMLGSEVSVEGLTAQSLNNCYIVIHRNSIIVRLGFWSQYAMTCLETKCTYLEQPDRRSLTGVSLLHRTLLRHHNLKYGFSKSSTNRVKQLNWFFPGYHRSLTLWSLTSKTNHLLSQALSSLASP